MPIGNPSKQTIASRKYQAKAGYIAKSYKIKKDLAEEFAAACEAAGVSQAAKISELMRGFIEETKKITRKPPICKITFDISDTI